jgi:hypothetical protein
MKNWHMGVLRHHYGLPGDLIPPTIIEPYIMIHAKETKNSPMDIFTKKSDTSFRQNPFFKGLITLQDTLQTHTFSNQ